MIPALQFEVKKDGFSQLQSGAYKLTVTLNPTDLDDNGQSLLLDFIKAPMGQRYMIGMAEIGEDEQPVERPKKAFADLSPSQQAGIRCNDRAFQTWLKANYEGIDWTKMDAAGFVRKYCGVRSRRHLDNGGDEASDWAHLNAQFEETRLPEQR